MDTTAFAAKGSQRWLQIAVARAPGLLDVALRSSGAIGECETVTWGSPLAREDFAEYRDREALRCLGILDLAKRSLIQFWPPRGPVWDALGVASGRAKILVEAKAHIAEAASPGSKASEESLAHIRRSLEEARAWYGPRATADWTGPLYQYANRLAFHYLLSKLNGIPSRLVFLDFVNAEDVGGRDAAHSCPSRSSGRSAEIRRVPCVSRCRQAASGARRYSSVAAQPLNTMRRA